MTPRKVIRIFFEGGGSTRRVSTPLRRGMSTFLGDLRRLADTKGIELRPIPCGSRQDAFEDFSDACTTYKHDLAVLLVDSECAPANPPRDCKSPIWFALSQYERQWKRPAGATDSSFYMMVHCMESWLVLDKAALRSYYGPTFKSDKIPDWPDVEVVLKQDVLGALRKATRACDEPYEKNHGFDLIGKIEPKLVQATRHGRRLFEGLRALIEELGQ